MREFSNNFSHHHQAADGEPEARKFPFRVCVTINAYIRVNVDAMDEIEAKQIVDDAYVCEQINTLSYDAIEILDSTVEFIDPA